MVFELLLQGSYCIEYTGSLHMMRGRISIQRRRIYLSIFLKLRRLGDLQNKLVTKLLARIDISLKSRSWNVLQDLQARLICIHEEASEEDKYI